jgi:uncharacterized membrane protein
MTSAYPTATTPFPLRVVHALERNPLVHGLSSALTAVTAPFVPAPSSPLRGGWLGHAVHPVLTDLPLGCWTSASLVDLVGGRDGRSAATRLVGLGVASAVPTALTGLADWSTLEGADRRIGAVHAVGNDVAIGLFVASLVARLRGRHASGVRLALLGNVATAGAGYLGGYLALSRGTADRTHGTAAA